MGKIEAALSNATEAHKDAMYNLKDGTKKGNSIFGRFETIKRLEAKTNKNIPEKHLWEIEVLPDDKVIVLNTYNDKSLTDSTIVD